MKEIKCKNCGGKIQVDENKEYGVCTYCGTEFKIKDEVNYNVNFNMDENTKEVFDTFTKGPFKMHKVASAIITIIAVAIFVIIGVSMFKDASSSDAEHFNFNFEHYEGGQIYFFGEKVLDDIIANNMNEEHRITVVYGDLSATTSEEVKNLKNTIEHKKYIFHFEKDKKGYINKLILTD